jgi:hypothetical protein
MPTVDLIAIIDTLVSKVARLTGTTERVVRLNVGLPVPGYWLCPECGAEFTSKAAARVCADIDLGSTD